ncbi:hypothetical protein, partial [Bathymodiolus thermophilus thioautotrophic gill symbiont]|uniref:hypothetical protein n=1 Tax=Bathymodiolus thermophilus thioautotrophic gill symbiont TaxID=2360 RepID=UPI001ED960A6
GYYLNKNSWVIITNTTLFFPIFDWLNITIPSILLLENSSDGIVKIIFRNSSGIVILFCLL